MMRSSRAAANGTASHHSQLATIRYSRREPRKEVGSPLVHRTPSSSEPGLSREASLGSTCRTTWWPSGVSTGDRGSSNALY